MDDILELLGTIPYDQRSSDSETAKDLRAMIQGQAVKRQQNSLRFQKESATQNRVASVPQELVPMMMQKDEAATEAPGDVGVLFGE